ncbi:hypothetical protein JCM8097_005669 [Rhodosporidiobolus ruineniae]
MLDRLPPEILHAILVLTYPPSPWPDQDGVDKKRRRTLTKLCLVFKAVGKRAQLLLWRKLRLRLVKTIEKATRLVKHRTPLVQAVRTIRLVNGDALEKTLPLIQACTGLRKVQLFGGWVSWRDLYGLDIRTLELLDIRVGLPADLEPSAVSRLTLQGVRMSKEAAMRFLQPETFPNLRVLTFGLFSTPENDEYFPYVDPGLANQVDTVQLNTSA